MGLASFSVVWVPDTVGPHINDGEENFNEEISLQNDKQDDNIDLDVGY